MPLTRWSKDIGLEAIKAVKAMNLDIASVDIAIDKTDMKPKVFECNTASWMDDETARRYAIFIKQYLKEIEETK